MASAAANSKLAVQLERLSVEKAELIRRLKERDAQSKELLEKLAAAQAKATEVAEALAVQQAERQLLEQAASRAESQSQARFVKLALRANRLEGCSQHAEGRAEALQAQLQSAADVQRETQAALAQAQQDLAHASEQVGELRASGESANARLDQLEGIVTEQHVELARLSHLLATAQAQAQAEAQRAHECERQLSAQKHAGAARLRTEREHLERRLSEAHAQLEAAAADRDRMAADHAAAQAENRMMREAATLAEERARAAVACRELCTPTEQMRAGHGAAGGSSKRECDAWGDGEARCRGLGFGSWRVDCASPHTPRRATAATFASPDRLTPHSHDSPIVGGAAGSVHTGSGCSPLAQEMRSWDWSW